jgi:hypothetical protein
LLALGISSSPDPFSTGMYSASSQFGSITISKPSFEAFAYPVFAYILTESLQKPTVFPYLCPSCRSSATRMLLRVA